MAARQRQHADRADDANGEEEGAESGDAASKVDWDSVDIVGGCLKMGVTR